MDLQTIINNQAAAQRAEQLKNSPQLLLGELILKLESVKNKELPVYYDYKDYFPTDLDSWRGSYCELAFNYDGDKPISAEKLLSILKEAVGKEFNGYKGGEFLMGKATPVWVANYGESGGFGRDKQNYDTYIVNIEEKEDKILLITKDDNY